MMLEPLLLFETVMVEDRPILELIDSDFAYRNKTLQTWYDDANAFADRGEERRYMLRQDRFTRRQLADRRQGGVITTAAVMTMTSTPIRTSPIVRGAWVAGVILNRPPKPPPDNIPDIEADEKDIAALGLTLRQRLEQHQKTIRAVRVTRRSIRTASRWKIMIRSVTGATNTRRGFLSMRAANCSAAFRLRM